MNKILQKCLILMMLLAGSQAFAWQMVYHNDANGNKIAGDLATLISAVENGHQVRVMNNGANGKFFYDADLLWIANGKVYLKNVRQVGLTNDGNIFQVQSSAYQMFIIYDTDGNVSRSRWLVGQHTSQGNDVYQSELKWFID